MYKFANLKILSETSAKNQRRETNPELREK